MYWESMERVEFVRFLKGFLTRFATGGTMDEATDYPAIRAWLMNDPILSEAAPQFIRDCRDLHDLWDRFKQVAPTYQGRRDYLRVELEPLFRLAEVGPSPMAAIAEQVLPQLDSEHVTVAWNKALSRSGVDPEGAITAARSLLESVFKAVLDEAETVYKDSEDLPELYRHVRKLLRLAPEDQTDEALKKVLGGAQSIVGGMAELRNNAGDAHGKGKYRLRPHARNARFAVNAAGTLAVFVVETWKAQGTTPSPTAATPR